MTCGYSALSPPSLLLVVEVVSNQFVDDLRDVAPLSYATNFQGLPVLVSQVDRGATIKISALGGESVCHGYSCF